MLNNLVIACLLAAGCSKSVPPPQTPAPSATQTTVVFAIDRKLKAEADMPTSHFELRSDGTWSFVETKLQAITKRAAGTLASDQLARVRALLAKATWQTTRDELRCMAEAITFDVFSVDGAPVWTEEMCSGAHLDATSSQQLAEVMKIVSPLIASAR